MTLLGKRGGPAIWKNAVFPQHIVDTSVFPIFRVSDGNIHQVLGSGFFLSNDGLFLTARHVIEDVISHGVMAHPTYVVYCDSWLPTRQGVLRYLSSLRTHKHTDIAGGRLCPQTNKNGAPVTNNVIRQLDVSAIPIGTRIWSIGCARATVIKGGNGPHINFRSKLYRGEVIDYFPHMGTMKPFPTYCTTMRIPKGASGGPVFTEDGKLFGLNTTGFSDILGGTSCVAALTPLYSGRGQL